MTNKKIQKALISVFYKDGLEKVIQTLQKYDVEIYSTGGTQKFIEAQGAKVRAVEDLTGYPSILGGRVKTLHPKVFGGILYRGKEKQDITQLEEYEIPSFDLVIVDLYPFEETLAEGKSEQEIIEKIDIGGISLIRAAAKNFKEITIVSSRNQYDTLVEMIEKGGGSTSLEDRKQLATIAFDVSSHYDTAIFKYFNGQTNATESFKESIQNSQTLRYGENPHQEGKFLGNLAEMFEQLNGKALSYNNLVDVDATVALIEEFEETAFAIIKHTNACGMAIADTPKEAYLKALAADPVSAFGAVIATNRTVDVETAEELHKLFFEVLIAPDFEPEALEILSQKKKRILLKKKQDLPKTPQFKTLLNGVILQDKDLKTEVREDLQTVTQVAPTEEQAEAFLFANKLVKHAKSNTIVLATQNQLIASGVGQTSRVDALKQAIEKALNFGFTLDENVVMASDAFFPFPDCVEIADQNGMKAVIQPGGSIKDKDSIRYCDDNEMTMVFTGTRHFKH